MTSEHVINLLGGLALFIFGMTFMSDGLKKLAGDYMKNILEKLTEKRIMAVLLGAGLTCTDPKLQCHVCHDCRICKCRNDAVRALCWNHHGC